MRADLLVVDGNPAANLRVLYPTGTDFFDDGKARRGGAVQWTIKAGRTYHGPTLMERVKEIVAEDRASGPKPAEGPSVNDGHGHE